jgi:hypothetical protein
MWLRREQISSIPSLGKYHDIRFNLSHLAHWHRNNDLLLLLQHQRPSNPSPALTTASLPSPSPPENQPSILLRAHLTPTTRPQHFQNHPLSRSPRYPRQLTKGISKWWMSLPTRPMLDKASIPKRQECEKAEVQEERLSLRPAAFKIELFSPMVATLSAPRPIMDPALEKNVCAGLPA